MALGTMPLAGTLKNGWVIPPANTGFGGADYLSRLDVAVFGLTANTVEQAIYYSGVLDGNNQPMTGAKKYTMTLTPPMAVRQAGAPRLLVGDDVRQAHELHRPEPDQPLPPRPTTTT